jgi:hypothetical protein
LKRCEPFLCGCCEKPVIASDQILSAGFVAIICQKIYAVVAEKQQDFFLGSKEMTHRQEPQESKQVSVNHARVAGGSVE